MNRKSTHQVTAWALALALGATLALAPAAGPARAAAPSAAAAAMLPGRVNINTANTTELQTLPGVGESRARAILALRKRKGGFKSVDQLVEVKGIGPVLLEKLRPHLALTGKTTARRN